VGRIFGTSHARPSAASPFASPIGNEQGYAVGREIAINPVAFHSAKAPFPELAHVVVGHTVVHTVATTLSEYAQHRSIMELAVEATADLVMKDRLLWRTPQPAVHQAWRVRGRPMAGPWDGLAVTMPRYLGRPLRTRGGTAVRP
jgi:hypothetical protein